MTSPKELPASESTSPKNRSRAKTFDDSQDARRPHLSLDTSTRPHNPPHVAEVEGMQILRRVPFFMADNSTQTYPWAPIAASRRDAPCPCNQCVGIRDIDDRLPRAVHDLLHNRVVRDHPELQGPIKSTISVLKNSLAGEKRAEAERDDALTLLKHQHEALQKAENDVNALKKLNDGQDEQLRAARAEANRARLKEREAVNDVQTAATDAMNKWKAEFSVTQEYWKSIVSNLQHFLKIMYEFQHKVDLVSNDVEVPRRLAVSSIDVGR